MSVDDREQLKRETAWNYGFALVMLQDLPVTEDRLIRAQNLQDDMKNLGIMDDDGRNAKQEYYGFQFNGAIAAWEQLTGKSYYEGRTS